MVSKIPPRGPMHFEQRKLLIAQAVLSNIALLTVLIRTYVRAIHLKSFKMDDWLMALAQLLNSLALVFLIGGFVAINKWGASSPLQHVGLR